MSARGPVTVVARWQPAPGALDELLSIIAQLRPQSLAEPGCLSYEVFRELGASTGILLLERYRDEAALDEHKRSAHYQALVVKRALPLLDERRVDFLHTRNPA